MIRKYIFIFILFPFCLITSDLGAFHIVGGEITYECLGSVGTNINRYRFELRVYRDNGCVVCATLEEQIQVGVFSGTGAPYTYLGAINPPPILQGPVDIPQPVIECLIPPEIQVEEGVYTWEVDLPVINENYYLGYQQCCRNSSISNIFNPNDEGVYYVQTLTPDAQAACNSSPAFNSFPPTVICVNEPLSFDHSASDADGDSLVYSFAAPITAGGDAGVGGNPGMITDCDGPRPRAECQPTFETVDFRVPVYTGTTPLGGDPVVTIDSETGLISGVPLTTGQFVVGVLVEEWRDGVLIGELRRDFQFNVEDCESTVVAQIQGDETLGERSYRSTFCGQSTVTIMNESFEETQINSYEWEIYNNSSLIQSFNTRDITVTFPDTGTYTGLLYLNRNSICEDSAEISLRILPETTANYGFDYDTCVVGPVVFSDSSSTEADQIVSYLWDFNGEGTSSLTSPVFNFPEPGQKTVSLLITDNNECESESIQTVLWQPAPQTIIVQPNTFLGCEPADITFTNLSSPIDDSYTFIWDFGDGNTSGELSPVHRYESSGVYDVSLEIISPIGCQVSDAFDRLIRVEPGPIADFDFKPKEVTSFNNTVQFINQSQDENAWFWDFNRLGFSTLEDPTYTFQDTGRQEVKLIVTRENGCQDTLIQYIDVIPEVIYHMPNAFTPNDDGTNETFRGKGILDGMSNFSFTVWNRWGEMIYQTDNPDEGWNGRVMNTGDDVPVGAYMYLVTFNGPRGEPYKFKGNANLIR